MQMEEHGIGTYGSLLTATEKESAPTICRKNLTNRISYLNSMFGDEEELFLYWTHVSSQDADNPVLCLCGHSVTHYSIFTRGDYRIIIGDKCIERFGTLEQKQMIQKDRRLTVDCEVCKSRIPKELNKSICNKCDNFPWGKYRNQSYRNVVLDEGYLEWLKGVLYKEPQKHAQMIKRLRAWEGCVAEGRNPQHKRLARKL